VTHDLGKLSVENLLEALASSAPVPGGGAACALAGALASALVSMVANLTFAKSTASTAALAEKRQLVAVQSEAEALRLRLTALMDADADAYERVIAAYRLPRVTPVEKAARRQAIEEALHEATRVPLEIATCCAQALALAEATVRLGSRSVASDAGAAAYLAEAGARAVLLNVEVNLGSIKDEAFAAMARQQQAALLAALPAARDAALAAMQAALTKGG